MVGEPAIEFSRLLRGPFEVALGKFLPNFSHDFPPFGRGQGTKLVEDFDGAHGRYRLDRALDRARGLLSLLERACRELGACAMLKQPNADRSFRAPIRWP